MTAGHNNTSPAVFKCCCRQVLFSIEAACADASTESRETESSCDAGPSHLRKQHSRSACKSQHCACHGTIYEGFYAHGYGSSRKRNLLSRERVPLTGRYTQRDTMGLYIVSCLNQRAQGKEAGCALGGGLRPAEAAAMAPARGSISWQMTTTSGLRLLNVLHTLRIVCVIRRSTATRLQHAAPVSRQHRRRTEHCAVSDTKCWLRQHDTTHCQTIRPRSRGPIASCQNRKEMDRGVSDATSTPSPGESHHCMYAATRVRSQTRHRR